MTTTRGATPPTKTIQNGTRSHRPGARPRHRPGHRPKRRPAGPPPRSSARSISLACARRAEPCASWARRSCATRAVLRTVPDLGQELVKISLGRSQVAPEKGDKRFADPAWQQNPLFRATRQSYLTWGAGMERYLDNLDLEGMAVERTRFGVVLLREAMAPTNFFATNPAAVKRCYDTGGGSVRRGLANWAGDMVHNHGLPSMVDRRPFTIGENMAATPGSVIFRNEVLELIQYRPRWSTTAHCCLPPPADGHGGREPDGAPGRHDGPGHAGRPVPHRVRHVRGGRADRPHHAVADLLPDHPAGLRALPVRAVLQRPHPDRRGRPEAPRLGCFVNPATPPKAEDWLAAAQRHEGSWWEHWVGWLAERSRGHSEAPDALGSISFPPKEPAPGTYILL